jgi:hypothetical protein
MQRAVLLRFLRYVGQALLEGDPVEPSTGTRKQLLPKLPGPPELVPGAGGRSFRYDVMGDWLTTPPPPTPPQDSSQVVRRRLRGKQSVKTSILVGTVGVPPKHETHQWRFRTNHWVCAACLKVSRAQRPNRVQKCSGFNSVMADLVANPLGHALSFSTFLDEAGIIILCTKCGGHCSSNRRAPKLCKPCKDKPLSPCAGAALERMCRLQHPTHAKGDAVVLSPWQPLSALATAVASRPAGPSQAATPKACAAERLSEAHGIRRGSGHPNPSGLV